MAQVPQIRQILHILITAVISSLQKTASRCIATTYIKLEQQCKEKIYKYISTWSILSVSETQLNNKLKIRATKKIKKEKKKITAQLNRYDSLSGLFPHLGSTLQLIHGGVVSWFACSTFGGTNEFGQSLRHIPHRVYQNHLGG